MRKSIEKSEMTYIDTVHRDGTIWNIAVMVILLMLVLLIGKI